MKMYALATQFTFGKYEGKTLQEVAELSPYYIEWCMLNLDHFYLSETTADKIEEIAAGKAGFGGPFKFSEESRTVITEKAKEYSNQMDDIEDSNEIEQDDRPSYGKYAGSYAQDMEGLSDDFIDNALDGDPDAYWNID